VGQEDTTRMRVISAKHRERINLQRRDPPGRDSSQDTARLISWCAVIFSSDEKEIRDRVHCERQTRKSSEIAKADLLG